MSITYEFFVDEDNPRTMSVDPARSRPGEPESGGAPADWTRLDHCQCSNCPLDTGDTEYCPAAVDMEPVIDAFSDQKAFQKIRIRVHSEHRTYEKITTVEEGLRSLLGLVMASSACPHLARLKPMAMHHMPFSTSNEFIMRSVSLYLLQQYFNRRDGREEDWDLQGLVQRNEELKLVNHALWQRIHAICEQDSNLKALLNFFSMASSVTSSLEEQLKEVREHFESGEPQ